MNRVERVCDWLRRLPHSLGFGIQSPWAYRFDRNVLNEHSPYYAYEKLDMAMGEIDAISKKLARLYFRIVNYRQPHVIVDYCADSDVYDEYMKAACKKAEIVKCTSGCSEPQYRALLSEVDNVEFVRISLTDNYRMFYDILRSRIDDNSIVVLEDIYKTKDTRKFWHEVVNGPQETVSFDLYYCGVVFFDKKRYKENYIINF